MSITKITIQYDSATQTATVNCGGADLHKWEQATLTLSKGMDESVRDGIVIRQANGNVSLHLDGVIPSLVSA